VHTFVFFSSRDRASSGEVPGSGYERLTLAVKWPAEIRTLHSGNPFVKGGNASESGHS
jgi:hypothetical protein